MPLRTSIVVALVFAAAVGCWNEPERVTSAPEGGPEPAPTQAADTAPASLVKPMAAEATPEVSPEVSPEVAAVAAAFERYRDAVLAKDWETASALVSRNIFEYYGRLRDDALYARIDELDAMPVFDEMQLFVLRQLASPPSSVALKEMTPEQVVKLAFERKLVGTDMHATAKVEKLVIEGPVATGRLFRNERDTEKVVRLQLEPEGWRVDLTPFFELTNQQMDELAKAGQREHREYGQRLVETFTGRFLDPALFEPLVPRPEAPPSAKP